MGRGAGIAGGLLNAGNVGRDFAGAKSRLLHVARNLLRSRALTASLDEVWIDET